MSENHAKPYPTMAFPPVLRNALHEVSDNLQVPDSLVGTAMIAALSLACQNRIDVCRQSGFVEPVSIFALVVASSGSGKTPVEKKIFQSIFEFQEREALAFELQAHKREAALIAWEIKDGEIRSEIKRNIKKGESFDSLTSELEKHLSLKPKQPLTTIKVLNDATTEAIKSAFHTESRSIGLISAEGGSILGGKEMRNLPMYNSLWDGDAISVDRKSSQTFLVKDPRLTMFLGVQEEVMAEFHKKRGRHARDVGIYARCLMAFPESKQGARFNNGAERSWKNVSAFNERMTEILKLPQNPRQILRFSPEAERLWIDTSNTLEAQMNPGGAYANAKDYASKFAGNWSRISALFHYFDGSEGYISYETAFKAGEICDWYADEFLRNIARKSVSVEQDAQQLDSWFANLAGEHGVYEIALIHIYQYAPVALRTKFRATPALKLLTSSGWIHERKLNGMTYFEFSRDHYPINPYKTLHAQYFNIHRENFKFSVGSGKV